jgi:hypothetical protein
MSGGDSQQPVQTGANTNDRGPWQWLGLAIGSFLCSLIAIGGVLFAADIEQLNTPDPRTGILYPYLLMMVATGVGLGVVVVYAVARRRAAGAKLGIGAVVVHIILLLPSALAVVAVIDSCFFGVIVAAVLRALSSSAPWYP